MITEWPKVKGTHSSSEPLAAVGEDDDARADEFCTPTENPARLDIFDKDHEVKSIVQRLGNPTMSPGDVAEMNAAMIIRHGAVIARISRPADKLKWLSRSEVFIGIMATVNTSGRFAGSSAIQLGYDRTLSSASRASAAALR